MSELIKGPSPFYFRIFKWHLVVKVGEEVQPNAVKKIQKSPNQKLY